MNILKKIISKKYLKNWLAFYLYHLNVKRKKVIQILGNRNKNQIIRSFILLSILVSFNDEILIYESQKIQATNPKLLTGS